MSSGFCNEAKWRERKSEHFIIYFKAADESFVADIIKEAESYYGEITRNLGFTRYNFWLWDNRAKFYIYDDAEDYLAQTNQPSWSAGAANYHDKVIRTYPQMAGFFDSLMPHELGHIIFREFIGNYTRIPLWLDEGVASYQEKSKRFAADSIVRKAISGKRFIPLDVLSKTDIRSSTDTALVELFYAESVSAVNFMITSFGKDRFGSFCRDLKDGKPFEEALARFNCKDSASFSKKWQSYLGAK